jgi:hypothetical protein
VQGVSVARVLDPSAGPRGYQYYVSFLAVTTKGDVPTLVIVTADTGCSAAFAPSAIGVDMSVQTHESGAQLIPGTLYYVRVRAVNSVGAGAPTAAQRVTNPALVTEVPRAKPGVPMYVSHGFLYSRGIPLTFLPLLPVHLLFFHDSCSCSPVSSCPCSNVVAWAVRDDRTKLRLTWQAPATDFGGAITLYRIQYATDNVFSDVCTTCPTSTTTTTIITLTPGTPYYIRIVAVSCPHASFLQQDPTT